MPCIFDIKPEDRHCEYCTVMNCDSREPKVPESHSTTQAMFIKEVQQNGFTTSDIRGI